MEDAAETTLNDPAHSLSGKALVTGGSGHLGANLVRRLLDEGLEVRVLARPHSNNQALDGLTVERVVGDLRDPAIASEAVAGCDFVFHCAAEVSTSEGTAKEKRAIFDANVLGTQHLLRAAKGAGVKKTVVTGSLSATGPDPDDASRVVDETAPFFPYRATMPYEISKVLVEYECLRAAADGLDVSVATSCAIIGPHDYKPSRLGRLLCDFAEGNLPAYIPGGFEFVTAQDIVEGHLLTATRGRAGQKYIFHSAFMTVDELLDCYAVITGQAKPRLRLPPLVMAGIASLTHRAQLLLFPDRPQRFTPGAVRILRKNRHTTSAKAKRELGYRPTTIQAAAQAAYDDFCRRGVIRRRSQAAVAHPLAGGTGSAGQSNGHAKQGVVASVRA